MTKKAPRELWTYAQIANLTKISVGTLRVWRNRGKLPTADYFIGEVSWPAWKPATIRSWWETQEQKKLSE